MSFDYWTLCHNGPSCWDEGSVANRGSGAEKVCLGRVEGLRSDNEDRVNELTLGDSITLGYPADLPFADGMHRLITFDRSARSLGRSESETRCDPLLDEPVVLFDDVV